MNLSKKKFFIRALHTADRDAQISALGVDRILAVLIFYSDSMFGKKFRKLTRS